MLSFKQYITEATTNIPISRILSTQLVSSAKIRSMVKKLEQGDELPPIDVETRSGGYKIVDGNHRYNAYVAAKRKRIPARVHADGWGKQWRQRNFRG